MNRKKVLLRRQARLEARKQKLLERSEASSDVYEVRAINEQLTSIAEDLQDIADELLAIADEEGAGDSGDSGNGEGSDGSGEGRSGEPIEGRSGNLIVTSTVEPEIRGANILGAFTQNTNVTEAATRSSVLDSLEYRQAFANYVRTGDTSGFATLEQRGEDEGMMITADIGKIIPNTIMNEFIKELKVYGQLYNKVRKLNIRGGVEFPIEDLVPEVRWINEHNPSSSQNQSEPELKNSVVFGYHIAEARIAQSLLSSVVSLPVLESEIAKILAEAFIREFDRMIVNGSGSGQPTGILNDSRVKAENKITFSDTEMADWTTWRTKFFAKIPLAYRGQGILVMTASTWESQIMTLKDSNNRPLYTETYDPVTGQLTCRFQGREVVLVEPDILKDFDTAGDGEAFAIYLKPTDYAINSNLQIGFKRYFDDDNNKWINKGLCIVDGKLLDVNGVYILKKSAAAEG